MPNAAKQSEKTPSKTPIVTYQHAEVKLGDSAGQLGP
jgi:hypothetical protein